MHNSVTVWSDIMLFKCPENTLKVFPQFFMYWLKITTVADRHTGWGWSFTLRRKTTIHTCAWMESPGFSRCQIHPSQQCWKSRNWDSQLCWPPGKVLPRQTLLPLQWNLVKRLEWTQMEQTGLRSRWLQAQEDPPPHRPHLHLTVIQKLTGNLELLKLSAEVISSKNIIHYSHPLKADIWIFQIFNRLLSDKY